MMKKSCALLITGPIKSLGRSGLSWGMESSEKWDIRTHDAIEDILYNVSEASKMGVSCFYFHDDEDELVEELADPRLTLVPVKDPYNRNFENSESFIRELLKTGGPLAKNRTVNDQRQAYFSKVGFDYLLQKQFSLSLRIRSDQKMNWSSLYADWLFASGRNKLLFPAQRDFTKLDANYTGFSVLDFFYGGNTAALASWFGNVLAGGRMYGPHQDIVWKPLLSNPEWKMSFPGLTTLSNLGNEEKQDLMARIFWNDFAVPSSSETMLELIWRGKKLNSNNYLVSRENISMIQSAYSQTKAYLARIAEMEVVPKFDWQIMERVIIGRYLEEDEEIIVRREILLDHALQVLHNGRRESISFFVRLIFRLSQKKTIKVIGTIRAFFRCLGRG